MTETATTPSGRSPNEGQLYSVGLTSISRVAGPLIVVEVARGVSYGELVDVVIDEPAEVRRGQVLEVSGDRAIVQVFGGTVGIGTAGTTVITRARRARTGVGLDYLGRVLDGSGRPRDGGPEPIAEATADVNGQAINPVARDHPDQMIETGLSVVDVLLTLVRGQKLPIFSGYGLPAEELAARIAADATVPGERAGEGFAVVFAAMGATRRSAEFFRNRLAEGPARHRSVLLLNLAEDPTAERLLTPRVALTIAEHLAFERGLHVLVVLTDMTSYCEALREVSAAREELPGRRGYPGYMYTDLSTIYERAGRVRGRPGSLTQLPILTMPEDDISHPVPDLTGYITEGQLVLSRVLQRQGVFPPVDVLPSLSRLMSSGIGEGRTREDHRAVADQIYACYARGVEVRRLLSIIGESALSAQDRRFLAFCERFEREFIGQGRERRTTGESLDLAWRLLAPFDDIDLARVTPELRRRFAPPTSVTGSHTKEDS
ncbi:MAG: V-type ATP synthase subunit B [Nocardioides sp.]